MCGVIGYVGAGATPSFFLNALRRLEYRGYDSSGIAMLSHGEISIQRAEGKLSQLEPKLALLPERAQVGIGHTRWATHGKPTENNAHPHRSGPFVLLHNGIIENYRLLKEGLIEKGYRFPAKLTQKLLRIFCLMSTKNSPMGQLKVECNERYARPCVN